MKSLLLAAVALLGFTVPSFGQEITNIYKLSVKFVTTDNANLSGQDIKVGFSSDDLKSVTPNSDGIYEETLSEDEFFQMFHAPLYYSINGFVSSTSQAKEDWEEKDAYTYIATYTYQINLYKLRFNYAGAVPTTITIYNHNSGENVILPLNKDNYLPSSYGRYIWGSSKTEISWYEDTVIDLPVLKLLTINSTMPESMKSSCYYNISKQVIEEYGSATSIYYSDVLSTENADNCIQPLEEGTYRVELRQRDGEYSSTSLGYKIIELTSDQTVSFSLYTVKIKVVEPDGTPVEGMQVAYNTDGSSYSFTTKETDGNGEITFVVTTDTKVAISSSTYWDTQKYTITGNKTITLTVPKVITIGVKYNGQPVDYVYLQGRKQHNIRFEKNESGTFSGRADPSDDYYLEFRSGDVYGHTGNDTKIYDGKTIHIGDFSTKSDGVGLAFNMAYGLNYNGHAYVILNGTPICIAAVPVGNEQFINWEINGHQYSSPMIDFTPKDDVTIATAKFSGEIANQVKSVAGQNAETIYVTVEGSYLVLPADVEAEAAIYAMDGKLTKKTGVVGNRLYIGNLPDGAYVLVLTVDGRRQTATFVTK